MSSIATTNASSAQNADRTVRDRDRRADDLIVGLVAAQSPDFLSLLQQNMGSEAAPKDERGGDRESAPPATRGEGGEDRPLRSREERAPAANVRRGDQNSAGAKERPLDDKPGASEASRPSAADKEPAADVKELLKDMQPATKEEAAAAQAVRPAATVPNNGAGVVRLDGSWRPIAIQNAQTAAAAPAPVPDAADVKGQVMSSMLRHAGLSAGKGDIVLHLKPAHLGKVDIRLTRVGERLEVHIRVESASAGQALREGSDDLGQLLLGRGSSWSEVAVHIESTEPEEGEETAEEQAAEEDRHHDGAERDPGQSDDREGER